MIIQKLGVVKKRIAEHETIPLLGCKRRFDLGWYGNPLVEKQGHQHFSPKSYKKKRNQLEHVSTEADIIHDRTRFRGSEYLVWLVITQWIGSPSVDNLFFFIIYF